jgi:chlorite dismutase
MTNPTAAKPATTPPTPLSIDVAEYGAKRDGERQVSHRRLFMQLVVCDVAGDADAAAASTAEELLARGISGVVYADAVNPRGVGLLTWSEDPAHLPQAARPLFSKGALRDAVLRPSYSMFGRTYSTGHEPDLSFALLRRPIDNVMNEAYPWHVWYPLRRTGAFVRLEPQEQGAILREHAHIGMAYGQQELAHDVRLACHGLDADDNEFVIGLVGRELHPLSHLVQTMRKTRQTAEYIAKMGPFFVGHVAHRSSP